MHQLPWLATAGELINRVIGTVIGRIESLGAKGHPSGLKQSTVLPLLFLGLTSMSLTPETRRLLISFGFRLMHAVVPSAITEGRPSRIMSITSRAALRRRRCS